MTIFGKTKAQTPAALALAEQVATKLADANAKAGRAETDLTRLALQFELGDEGVDVGEADLSRAKGERDKAREVVERLNAAHVEALRRLEEAKAVDAKAELDALWADVGQRRDQAKQDLAAWIDALKTAARLGDRYLAGREALAKVSPATSARFPGGEPMLILQGLDRALHIVELATTGFHPRPRPSFARSLEGEVQAERDVLDHLATRVLAVTAPPSPPAATVVPGPMRAVGFAVKGGRAA